MDQTALDADSLNELESGSSGESGLSSEGSVGFGLIDTVEAL